MNRTIQGISANPETVSDTGIRRIPRDSVISKINPHLLNLLKIETEHETGTVPARALLSPARFDVMAKVIYARHRELNGSMSWATHVYREHLKILSGFEEGDKSGKTCFDDYRAAFDTLIDSVKSGGFRPETSMLPVGRNLEIIDGAHRLGAALLYDTPVQVIHFDMQPNRYDYRYFRRRGLAEDIADAMAMEYCHLEKNLRVAVLFPVAHQHRERVISLLGDNNIAYEKNIRIHGAGKGNLIRLLYAGEHWVGSKHRETRGVRDHIENRFNDKHPVTLLFFEHDDAEQLRRIKENIRSIIGQGNYSIHISDSRAESLRVAEVVLNSGGVHWLNHSQRKKTGEFDRCIREYRQRLPADRMGREKFCIDGSGVLAVYGIRDVNDLDYLCLPGSSLKPGIEDISCHNEENEYYEASIEDIIADPQLHFFSQGLKFIRLQQLQKMKACRNERKDRLDVQRINALTQNKGILYSPAMIWNRLREFMSSSRYRIVRWLRRHLPGQLLPLARYVYQLPSRFSEMTGPDKRTMLYRGFVLHYSKGTSLVHGISKGETYEPAVTSRIVSELETSGNRTFLDIGANIGLISLNIIHEIPEAVIYAFEPGEHQASLLRETVAENDLQNRVTIFRKALGEETGETEFIVHSSEHASGDGLRDTGRAGKGQSIKVPITTLDEWWSSSGEPAIDVVKIDTEGAELLVLSHACSFLDKCRPVLVMEIDLRNLDAYSYDASDIVSWLNNAGYRVETLDGTVATAGNIDDLQKNTSDYVAIPITGDKAMAQQA